MYSKKVWNFIHTTFLIFCLSWIFGTSIFVSVVLATPQQSRDDIEVEELRKREADQRVLTMMNTDRLNDAERRITNIESKDWEGRVSKIETLMEMNNKMLVAIALGLGTLILEAFLRIVNKKKAG